MTPPYKGANVNNNLLYPCRKKQPARRLKSGGPFPFDYSAEIR